MRRPNPKERTLPPRARWRRLIAGLVALIAGTWASAQAVPLATSGVWAVLAIALTLLTIGAGIYAFAQVWLLLHQVGDRYARGEPLWGPAGYRCHECGYDFRGATGAYCPECGTVRPAPLERDEPHLSP